MGVLRFYALAVAMFAGIGLVARSPTQVEHDAVRFLSVEQGADEARADEALARRLSGLVEAPQPVSYNQAVNDVGDDEREGGTLPA